MEPALTGESAKVPDEEAPGEEEKTKEESSQEKEESSQAKEESSQANPESKAEEKTKDELMASQPEVPPVSPIVRVEETTDLLGEIVADDSFEMSWDISPTKRISMMLSDADASDDEEFSLVSYHLHNVILAGINVCTRSSNIFFSDFRLPLKQEDD